MFQAKARRRKRTRADEPREENWAQNLKDHLHWRRPWGAVGDYLVGSSQRKLSGVWTILDHVGPCAGHSVLDSCIRPRTF